MNLVKIRLNYTDSDSADTEIKYAVVSTKIEDAELVMLIMPDEAPAVQKRIFAQAKRILKQFKEMGKVSFIAAPDNFLKSDTVSQYVQAMFPELISQIPSIASGCEFLLFKH